MKVLQKKKNMTRNVKCLTIFFYCFFIAVSISMVNKRESFLWIFVEYMRDQFRDGCTRSLGPPYEFYIFNFTWNSSVTDACLNSFLRFVFTLSVLLEPTYPRSQR